MTLAQIIEAAYSIQETEADTPVSGEDDYTIATRRINSGINMWEYEEGMLWNELWTKLSAAATGDKTTSAGDKVYDCPTDFRFPGGYVRLSNGTTSTYFQVVKNYDSSALDNRDANICWFTGNPQDGYDLNFLDGPGGTYTISYEYYKTADSLSLTTDSPEMADPYFLVWYLVWRLYKDDGQTEQANEAKDIMLGKLSQMKTRNLMSTWYESREIYDVSETGFGN